MPAVHFDECVMAGMLGLLDVDLPTYPNKGHREDCDLPNKQKNGRMRMFVASIRCYCPCHDPEPPHMIEEIP